MTGTDKQLLKKEREIIYNVPEGSLTSYIIHKSVKKGQSSFRITRQLLQTIFNKAVKIQKNGELIIEVPVNEKENFILTCKLTKAKKI